MDDVSMRRWVCVACFTVVDDVWHPVCWECGKRTVVERIGVPVEEHVRLLHAGRLRLITWPPRARPIAGSGSDSAA